MTTRRFASSVLLSSPIAHFALIHSLASNAKTTRNWSLPASRPRMDRSTSFAQIKSILESQKITRKWTTKSAPQLITVCTVPAKETPIVLAARMGTFCVEPNALQLKLQSHQGSSMTFLSKVSRILLLHTPNMKPTHRSVKTEKISAIHWHTSKQYSTSC